jgi:predicted Zn-dependent peptidase
MYANHPVRDDIAGSVESIARIDAATLQRCYGLFYHPSNMCLAVSGGVDPEQILECVLADQAERGVDPLPPHRRPTVDEPRRVVRARHEERLPVSRTRWLMGIKELDPGGDGETVLRRELSTHVLLDLLFGRASPAFEALYEEGLVDETWGVGHSAEESFAFSTLGGDTDDPERLEQRVREVLALAREVEPDPAALRRVRRKLLGGMLRALDSPEHVAYGLLGGAFRGLAPFAALALVESIGPDDLRRRLQEHVRDEAIAVSLVRPLDGA